MPEVVPVRANQAIGAYGERVAARHLEQAGYAIVDRNWRCDIGEIDIVARDGSTVVFCEVKTRSGDGFGSGLEAVTTAKAARLRRLGQRWLHTHGFGPAAGRYDVIAVHRGPTGAPVIEHLRGAF